MSTAIQNKLERIKKKRNPEAIRKKKELIKQIDKECNFAYKILKSIYERNYGKGSFRAEYANISEQERSRVYRFYFDSVYKNLKTLKPKERLILYKNFCEELTRNFKNWEHQSRSNYIGFLFNRNDFMAFVKRKQSKVAGNNEEWDF